MPTGPTTGGELPGLNPRAPEPGEIDLWNRFANEYRERMTPAVWAAIKTGEVCGTVQEWFNREGVPIIVWDAASQARVDELINEANTLGRLIEGALAQKYYVAFPGGDVTICARPDARPEEYEGDMLPPTLGFVFTVPTLIVIGIVAGIVTVLTGGYVYTTHVKAKATQQQRDYTSKMQSVAAQIAQQPAKVQDAYRRMMKDNEPLLKATAAATGDSWWDKLTGGLKKGIGIAAVGLVAVIALSLMGKAKSAGIINGNGRAAA